MSQVIHHLEGIENQSIALNLTAIHLISWKQLNRNLCENKTKSNNGFTFKMQFVIRKSNWNTQNTHWINKQDTFERILNAPKGGHFILWFIEHFSYLSCFILIYGTNFIIKIHLFLLLNGRYDTETPTTSVKQFGLS